MSITAAASRHLALFFAGLASISSVEARQGTQPDSYSLQLSNAATFELPAVDAELEKSFSDLADKGGAPLRFAQPFKTSITTKTHGSWTAVSGGRLWRMQFDSQGATDLNFGFSAFALPRGARLYFLSDTTAMPRFFDGPYTDSDNRAHGQFWSAPVPGGQVTLELFLPERYAGRFEFELTQVSLGFRDTFRIFGGDGLSKQGSCNNDVVCPEGDLWRDEIRSVAAYTIGGIDACTGTMVMDADRTFRPYFLTAYHCSVTAANAASVVTLWNYESPTCGALSGGSRLESVSGTVFRASRQDVDMALLELSAMPPTGYNVYWAGWDRTDNIPDGSVGIHHPGVDEKAISFNLDPLTYVNGCISGTGTNTHWRVNNWEDGTTEPGSSGSALFDPANKNVIGFLSGGSASCSSITEDCYGRFAVAWTGGNSDAERLEPWLDPSGTGAMAVTGSDPGDFSLSVDPAALAVCKPEDAVATVSVLANPGSGFNDAVTLSIDGVPTGATAAFGENPVLPAGNTGLTISNTVAAADGQYNLSIGGSANGSSVSAALQLSLFAPVGIAPSLTSPANGAGGVSSLALLQWSDVSGAQTYQVEIATDAGFLNIVDTATTSDTQYAAALGANSTYYWRVTADNACESAVTSASFSFTTGADYCAAPLAAIPDGNAAGIVNAINVSESGLLTDLNVALNIDHTWVGDLIVTLEHAASGIEVDLLNRPGSGDLGCDGDDVDVVFDDEGTGSADAQCANNPAISGNRTPFAALSAFDGLDLAGQWNLSVSDNVSQDTGTLQEWCLIPEIGGVMIFRDGFEAAPAGL